MAEYKVLKKVLLKGERKARSVGEVVEIKNQKDVEWLLKYNIIGDPKTATVTTAGADVATFEPSGKKGK